MKHTMLAMVCVTAALTGPAGAEVRGQEVIYADGQVALEGYLAWDDDIEGRRPAVLVVHEWWGLNEYARMRARQLAEMGYLALAADIYGRGERAETREQAAALAGKFRKDSALLRRRAQVALDRLRDDARAIPTRVAAIGYCFGGTTVLELARSGADLAAVVSFHGGLATDDPAGPGEITAAILVCHGADDPHVSSKDLADFIEEMRRSGADWQLNMYGGAVHTFTNPDAGDNASTGSAYNELAARRSWMAMKLLFTETIGLPQAAGEMTVGEFFKDYVATPVGKAGKATGKAFKRAYEWSKEQVD